MLDALPKSGEDLTTVSAPSTASELTRVRPVQPSRHVQSKRLARRLPLLLLPVAAIGAAVAIVMHLTVSASPAQVVLPSLVSTDGRSAQLVARSFNLRPRVILQYSSQIPSGVVAGQIPRAGTEVARGTVITLMVSRGPRPVQIPDVNGLSTADAETRLTAAGFRVSVQTQEDIFGQPDTVLSESPNADTYALPAATITITVSQAPWWEFWR
jgi:serine/threonine-protein kinase